MNCELLGFVSMGKFEKPRKISFSTTPIKFNIKIAHRTRGKVSIFIVFVIVSFLLFFLLFLYCFNPTSRSEKFQKICGKSFPLILKLCKINTAPITISSKIEKVWRLRKTIPLPKDKVFELYNIWS